MIRKIVIAAALSVMSPIAMSLPASAGTTSTAYGAVVKPYWGESFPQAVARSEATYGHLGVIRYFMPATLEPWSSLDTKLTDHTSILSWAALPSSINSGSQDTAFTKWLAAAPTDHPIYFAYAHEPDAKIAQGKYTSVAYKLAYSHVAAMVRASGKTNIQLALVLTCFSAKPKTGRDWHDYYTTSSEVDVMAFDCYNHVTSTGFYGSPTTLFGPAAAWAIQAGEPFAAAEVGALVPGGSDGSGRANWLLSVRDYLTANNAVFGSYFDTNGAGTDYRLLDSPSQQAWHQVVSG
jgi:hypothetical protein